MIVAVHAAAHIAINCIPINWNLPISFGRFRQAEIAVLQQELRPVTQQDLECPSPGKEHRRRGKRYPDKAFTGHGPIYNRCNQFLENSLKSVRASMTAKTSAAESQTDASSSLNPPTITAESQTFSIKLPTGTAESQTDACSCLNPPMETAVSQTDARSSLNPPTETAVSQTDARSSLNPPTESAVSQTDARSSLNPSTEKAVSQTDARSSLNPPTESAVSQTDARSSLNPPTESAVSQTDARSSLNLPTETAWLQTEKIDAAQQSEVASQTDIPTACEPADNTQTPICADASGDAFGNAKPTEKSVSLESYCPSSEEEAVMEDKSDFIESRNSTPTDSPWGSLEPEPSLPKDQNDVKEIPLASVEKTTSNSKDQDASAIPDPGPELILNRKENGAIDRIGKGTFGSVYTGKYRGTHVAVKLTGPATFRNETEGQVFSRIGYHPYIISLHTVYHDGTGKDLLETLVLDCAATHLTNNVINTIATDPALDFTAYTANCLMFALEHIHRKGYVHLDVSPGNVLLTHSGVPKLADFSSSLQWKKGDKPLKVYPIGTVGFRAPEIIRKSGYDNGADFFSLGVLIYNMVNGRLPWRRSDIAQMNFINKGKPGLEDKLPEPFRKFISSLLSDEPGSRITEDVLVFLRDKTALGSDMRR